MSSKTSAKRRKKQQPSIEDDTSNLPCDLMCMILSRLPVKSLQRFRSVSKPWRALISDPKFVKAHTFQSTGEKLVLSGPKSLTNPKFFYITDYKTPNPSSQEQQFHVKKYRDAKILGSCNGLVLLGIPRDPKFVLWNPSLKKVHKTYSCVDAKHSDHRVVGLCYDSSVNDYKAVFNIYINRIYSAVVFSFKSGSSKRINSKYRGYYPRNYQKFAPYDHERAQEQIAVNVNEKLHWIMEVESDFHNWAIVYFDVVEERSKEVPLPESTIWDEFADAFAAQSYGLSVIRGCLCLYSRRHCQIVTWTMKEYGVKESWTRQDIRIPDKILGHVTLSWLKTFCFTCEGEFVFVMDSDLLLYNPEKKIYKTLVKGIWGFSAAVTFVDSLVLPAYHRMGKKRTL